MNFTQILKKIFRKAGYDVSRISVTSNSSLQLVKGFEHFNIDLVLDIGANIGQFSTDLRHFGYKGRIVSFEPLSSAHAMVEKSAKTDPLWDVHERSAIGDSDGSEKVKLYKLDTAGPKYIDQATNTFVKIDTQGFEWQVIQGAEKVLPRIKGILCETSIMPLYEGQHLWLEMITKFEDLGYTLWSIQKGFSDERDGRSLQVDLVFYRL